MLALVSLSHRGMRQLKKVLEAFTTLRRDPAKAIGDTWTTVKLAALASTATASADARANITAAVDTIDSIVTAIIGDLSAKPEQKTEG